MTYFRVDSSVTGDQMWGVGGSSRVCHSDTKTFFHPISAQLHKCGSKTSGEVECTCDRREGFSATGLFACHHVNVFLCGAGDLTRKQDRAPETQCCCLKTRTKPASACLTIKWVEQSGSSCQKNATTVVVEAPGPLMKPLYTRLETKPLILVLQTGPISTLSLS